MLKYTITRVDCIVHVRILSIDDTVRLFIRCHGGLVELHGYKIVECKNDEEFGDLNINSLEMSWHFKNADMACREYGCIKNALSDLIVSVNLWLKYLDNEGETIELH